MRSGATGGDTRRSKTAAALFAALLCVGLWSSVGTWSNRALAAEEEHGDDTASEEHAEDDEPGGEHEFNFYYGLLGEGDAEAEPTLWVRPKGMPVPFLAMLINAGVLFGGLYWLGRKSLKQALDQRRQRIVRGMEDAAKMKREATEQLAMYERKLKDIESEVERLRRDMHDAAERERSNILAEAKARRERMEREAKQHIEQELHAAQERLRKETIRGAVESATRLLSERITGDDRLRLEREYLDSVGSGLGSSESTRAGSTPRGQA